MGHGGRRGRGVGGARHLGGQGIGAHLDGGEPHGRLVARDERLAETWGESLVVLVMVVVVVVVRHKDNFSVFVHDCGRGFCLFSKIYLCVM